MDEFLTHTFSIQNHPICELKEQFRIQYVMGLGEFMCYMSKKDSRASLVFKVWSNSIVTEMPSFCWQYNEDCNRIRKALSLKRDGIRFFTMRREFFFDCFYLVSKINPKFVSFAYTFLYEHVRDVIAKRVLKNIFDNWGKPTLQKIPAQLIAHQRKDEEFQKKPLKRVLVVATMSAGKSTLINALVGFRVNKTSTTVCTNRISYLYNKPASDGIIIRRTDNSYMYRYDVEAKDKGEFAEAALHYNSSLSNSKICLIDSPGSNYSADTTHGEMTRKMIASNHYDAIVFVVNSTQFNTIDEASLREYVIQHTKKPIVFVINQLDCFNPEDDSVQEIMEKLDKLLYNKVKHYEIVPLSAYYALLIKLGVKELTKQEQIQKERFKHLFQYDYYDLPKYYRGELCLPNSKEEIEKTGITVLEKVLCNL